MKTPTCYNTSPDQVLINRPRPTRIDLVRYLERDQLDTPRLSGAACQGYCASCYSSCNVATLGDR
jgi:hypothetical protein